MVVRKEALLYYQVIRDRFLTHPSEVLKDVHMAQKE